MIFRNVTFSTFRALKDKSIRITLDTQELKKNEMGELSELYNGGEVTVLISNDEKELEYAQRFIELARENPEILEKLR